MPAEQGYEVHRDRLSDPQTPICKLQDHLAFDRVPACLLELVLEPESELD